MGEEFVSIRAGGAEVTNFLRVMVRTAFNESAREFQIDIAAEGGAARAAWQFRPGTEVDILFNGGLVLRGYVDRYQPRMSEHSEAKISISGRSKSQDAIDSSAEHKTGRFENKSVLEILTELDKFGVGFKSSENLEKIPHYQITPGERVMSLGEKLCRAQGLFLTGQPDGSVEIGRGGKQRHAGGLIEGINIKSADADHNWSNRHSKVVVRGQRPYGHGPDALQIEAAAADSSVGRYRPVIIHNDDDTDKGRAKKRAKHRRDRESGEALKANVTVQGFRDVSGKIWTPGHLVWTESPFLAITQDMAIESVTFSQERGRGSDSMLSLVDPRALGGKGGKGGKSGQAWKSDAGND